MHKPKNEPTFISFRKEKLKKFIAKQYIPKSDIDYDPENFPTMEKIRNYQIDEIFQHITIKLDGR